MIRGLRRFEGEGGTDMDAVTVLAETVATCRGRAAEDPVHLPDLAGALTNLANRCDSVDALAAAEKSVTIYRQVVQRNPVHLGDFGTALSNVGSPTPSPRWT